MVKKSETKECKKVLKDRLQESLDSVLKVTFVFFMRTLLMVSCKSVDIAIRVNCFFLMQC